MTIYIAGPDGKPLAFASHAEVEDYQRAQREAEPPLLQCLRKHRRAVMALQEQAERELAQRRGRSAALTSSESRLRGLGNAMADDIKAANSSTSAFGTAIENIAARAFTDGARDDRG